MKINRVGNYITGVIYYSSFFLVAFLTLGGNSKFFPKLYGGNLDLLNTFVLPDGSNITSFHTILE